MTRRSIIASVASLILALAVSAGPVSAYNPHGGEFTTATFFDSNGNGLADVLICFEDNSPVYTGRGVIADAVKQTWAKAATHEIVSMGVCNNDGSNIEFVWGNGLTSCSGTTITIADATYPAPGEYSKATVRFNSGCPWYIGLPLPVPDGYYDMWTTAIHEAGHAYGFGHPAVTDNPSIMKVAAYRCSGGTSILGKRTYFTANDALGMRAVYAGKLPASSTTWASNPACAD